MLLGEICDPRKMWRTLGVHCWYGSGGSLIAYLFRSLCELFYGVRRAECAISKQSDCF